MEKSKMTSKGQIVIPSRIRRRYKIKKGTFVCFQEKGNQLLLTPCNNEFIEGLKGSLGTKGKAIKALLEEKKKEREL